MGGWVGAGDVGLGGVGACVGFGDWVGGAAVAVIIITVGVAIGIGVFRVVGVVVVAVGGMARTDVCGWSDVSGIRVRETGSTEGNLGTVEVHRKTEFLPCKVPLTLFLFAFIPIELACHQQVDIPVQRLPSTSRREPIHRWNFGEPVIQLDSVFPDTLLNLPGSFTDTLYAVDFVDDGLRDKDQIHEAEEER